MLNRLVGWSCQAVGVKLVNWRGKIQVLPKYFLIFTSDIFTIFRYFSSTSFIFSSLFLKFLDTSSVLPFLKHFLEISGTSQVLPTLLEPYFKFWILLKYFLVFLESVFQNCRYFWSTSIFLELFFNIIKYFPRTFYFWNAGTSQVLPVFTLEYF